MSYQYGSTFEEELPPNGDPEILERASRMHVLGQIPIVSIQYARQFGPCIAPAGAINGFQYHWFSDFQEFGRWSLVTIYTDAEIDGGYVT